jgi:anti-anti-sigma regulatory factor
MSSPGIETLVLDLASVDYLSGAALSVIEGLSQELSARAGRLSLCRPSVPARLAIELSGSPLETISQGRAVL